MKHFLSHFLAGAALVFAGCSHLDMTPEGEPDRVLTGTVNIRAPEFFPAGSTVLVRLVDNAPSEGTGLVLGEQTLKPAAGSDSAAFRIEYRAEDAVLRRGVEVQVRVSADGKIRFVNTASGSRLTLGHEADPLEVWVAPTQ